MREGAKLEIIARRVRTTGYKECTRKLDEEKAAKSLTEWFGTHLLRARTSDDISPFFLPNVRATGLCGMRALMSLLELSLYFGMLLRADLYRLHLVLHSRNPIHCSPAFHISANAATTRFPPPSRPPLPGSLFFQEQPWSICRLSNRCLGHLAILHQLHRPLDCKLVWHAAALEQDAHDVIWPRHVAHNFKEQLVVTLLRRRPTAAVTSVIIRRARQMAEKRIIDQARRIAAEGCQLPQRQAPLGQRRRRALKDVRRGLLGGGR